VKPRVVVAYINCSSNDSSLVNNTYSTSKGIIVQWKLSRSASAPLSPRRTAPPRPGRRRSRSSTPEAMSAAGGSSSSPSSALRYVCARLLLPLPPFPPVTAGFVMICRSRGSILTGSRPSSAALDVQWPCNGVARVMREVPAVCWPHRFPALLKG
jgi:hypothetical protein